ncbi:glycoside hydrolase family 31 protein [Coprobacter sp.]
MKIKTTEIGDRYLRLFCLLTFLGIFFLTYAQEEKGWKSDWKGNREEMKILKPGLDVTGVAIPQYKVFLDARSKDISLLRELSDDCRNSRTLWLSFLVRKNSGDDRFGLSLQEGMKEKLFIGTSRTDDHICFGMEKSREKMNKAVQLVVRIDFSDAGDKAYLFINPPLASVPDIEGASVTLSGDFSFDHVSFICKKGCSGEFSRVVAGKQFSDVVFPRKSNDDLKITGAQPVISWKKDKDILWIETEAGMLRLKPYEFGALSVHFGSVEAMNAEKNYAVPVDLKGTKFSVRETETQIRLKTSRFSVAVDKATGQIGLYDRSGKLLVQEYPGGGRSAVGQNEKVACRFQLSSDEALYGLGQFRDNALNLRGKRRELVQFNTQAAVPVLYSTNGWGILWNNPSRTIFKDDKTGLSFQSDLGNILSYYYFVGDKLDDLVASYRSLTGKAPMVPYWSLGYHQSRNKYATQKEVLSIAERMRQENIPMSTIFIDYFYWQKYGTGSHKFDENLFPDVPGMLNSLHKDYNTHAVITMWPTFRPGIPNYEEFNKKGLLLDGAKALDGIIYDAFSPEAAKIYWKQVLPLVNLGIDGWFLDGCEPDQVNSFLPTTTHDGPALKVRNLYPLVHATTFYNGLLEARPNQRPYILTRCAWASQQKVGTAVWSGDIPTTFDELRKQVTAGLNFVATGIPYWTTDIGGYSGGDPADENYREVFTRWFQYGTFCPVFRAHGRRYPGDTRVPNELWAYGKEAQKICTDFINLRYALFPYIYTLTGQITRQHYTPMRLLAFDFPEDEQVLDCKDQFMYGPSLLICPVLDAGERQRSVYLPSGRRWFDFWSGEVHKGGSSIKADAPIDLIPVFVPAGSIIPMNLDVLMNPDSSAPVEIRVYSGADGQFEWYEDDGKTFDCENGEYSLIPVSWNDKSKILTIGERQGKYNGMSKDRELRIVIVSLEKGIGLQKNTPDKVVEYTGKKLSIKL